MIPSIRTTLGIALLLPLLSQSTFAQSQGAGNGGGASELSEFTGRNGEHLQSWYQVKQDLINGLMLNRHTSLDLHGINADEFKTKALRALREVSVEFVAKKIVINGVTRSCRNSVTPPSLPKIVCDPETYVKEMQNYTSEEQYRLIAHEYLGAAGLEPNQYGLSDFPFSSQISMSLKNVQVKRWGVLATDESSIDLDQLDSDAIFNETSQSKIEQHLKNKYDIPFRYLSSPRIVDINVNEEKRTYAITVFRRTEDVALSCDLKLTVQTRYPRAENQRSSEEYIKTAWNRQLSQLVQIDSQLAVKNSQANMSMAVELMISMSDTSEHIDYLSQKERWSSRFVKNLAGGIIDPEYYTRPNLSQPEQQHLQQLSQMIQQRAQQRQQDEQARGQQQQIQQQQAHAPTPVAISSLVNIDSECFIVKQKGGPQVQTLTLENSEVFRYGVEHHMIKK